MLMNMNTTVTPYIKMLSAHLRTMYPTQQEQQQVAFLLLEKVTGKTRVALIGEKNFALTQKEDEHLRQMLEEHLVHRKPLQYILGSVPFGDVEILVEPPLLIPRPETEAWVMNLVVQLKNLHNQNLKILDMCTGSGAVALALAHALPKVTIYAVDIDVQAVKLARKNAHFNHLTNIHFLESDLFAHVPQELKFDLIVTNPPYISHEEYCDLDPMVKQWESPKALVAQENGLACIKALIEQAPEHLKHNDELLQAGIGNFFCEIGYRQGDAVKALLHVQGYKNVSILKDLAGHDRVVAGFYQR